MDFIWSRSQEVFPATQADSVPEKHRLNRRRAAFIYVSMVPPLNDKLGLHVT